MIDKIISGGQTGADRAALDAAIKWQIPHGGWIPKGRLTESGELPERYQLQEMPTKSWQACAEQNVIESDGTLIISHGPPSGGPKYTQETALKHHRPYLHIDLNNYNTFEAAKDVYQWAIKHNIASLNVSGSRASKNHYIYQATMHLITAVLNFDLTNSVIPASDKKSSTMPRTVNKAVEMLISKLELKDCVRIAKMLEADLVYLHITLGNYICETFGLRSGNVLLMESCQRIIGKKEIREDEASYAIISAVWKSLHNTHVIRIIK
jgi:hypothetical protein